MQEKIQVGVVCATVPVMNQAQSSREGSVGAQRINAGSESAGWCSSGLSPATLIRQLEISSSFLSHRVKIDRSTRRLAAAMLAQALRDAVSITKVKSQPKQVRWRTDAANPFDSRTRRS